MSDTLRDKLKQLAFFHECNEGGGKYILLLDDVDALLAEDSSEFAAGAEYMRERAAQAIQSNSCIPLCELCEITPCGKNAAKVIRSLKVEGR